MNDLSKLRPIYWRELRRKEEEREENAIVLIAAIIMAFSFAIDALIR